MKIDGLGVMDWQKKQNEVVAEHVKRSCKMSNKMVFIF